jgi:hypothetical protein|tara:strand:- start:841 stop:960 length:120 start_codon:yes stop_codon:yes gene_type:complete
LYELEEFNESIKAGMKPQNPLTEKINANPLSEEINVELN